MEVNLREYTLRVLKNTNTKVKCFLLSHKDHYVANKPSQIFLQPINEISFEEWETILRFSTNTISTNVRNSLDLINFDF